MTQRYTVLPFDPDNVDWMHEQSLPIPAVDGASRFPTLIELRQAISQLPGYSLEFGEPNQEDPWQATITHSAGAEEASAEIRITPFQGEDTPHGFWFEKAQPPLVIGLLKSLAAFTGPLAVLAISDGAATVVDAGSDEQSVLQTWKHTSGQ